MSVAFYCIEIERGETKKPGCRQPGGKMDSSIRLLHYSNRNVHFPPGKKIKVAVKIVPRIQKHYGPVQEKLKVVKQMNRHIGTHSADDPQFTKTTIIKVGQNATFFSALLLFFLSTVLREPLD